MAGDEAAMEEIKYPFPIHTMLVRFNFMHLLSVECWTRRNIPERPWTLNGNFLLWSSCQGTICPSIGSGREEEEEEERESKMKNSHQKKRIHSVDPNGLPPLE